MTGEQRLVFGNFHRGVDHTFHQLWKEMDRMTHFPNVWGERESVSPHMKMDIVEREDHYGVHVDLPGIPKEDISINLEGDSLVISAERNISKQQDHENYHLMERLFGKISRRIRVPKDVDMDHAEAKYENGVLDLTLPRSVPKPRSKSIQIQ